MMNEERDTKFAKSGNLLLEELLAVDMSKEHWRRDCQKIIAHYAYGLAEHICSQLALTNHDAELIDDDALLIVRSMIDALPDMVEWPRYLAREANGENISSSTKDSSSEK